MKSNNPLSLVCCTPFNDEKWRWFASSFDLKLFHWQFYYAKTQGILEIIITTPNLNIMRISLDAVKYIKKNSSDILFTHQPSVSFWCAVFLEIMKVKIDHIAYSFNFPKLPRGIKYFWMKKAFKNIDKFIVYSSMEKTIYHQYFDIPLEKIDFCLWSVNTPQIAPKTPIEKGDYICAIGGNERDYKTLLLAIKKLQDIKLVMVVRPHNLKKLEIPSNVKVLINITPPEAMNILKYSRFMVLPLKSSEVPCGHVTLVAAMHLEKAFIITQSQGVKDYTIDNYNCLVYPANAADELVKNMKKLWNDPEKCKILGQNGRKFAEKYCSEASAREHLSNLLEEYIT